MLKTLGLADAQHITQVASTTMRCLADNGKQAGLKAHLTLREVIGTNLPGTVQWQFNEHW